jgi:hypothetical protein
MGFALKLEEKHRVSLFGRLLNCHPRRDAPAANRRPDGILSNCRSGGNPFAIPHLGDFDGSGDPPLPNGGPTIVSLSQKSWGDGFPPPETLV